MKITKLALIAPLAGALMAIGCGDDATATGGSGGGGNGGMGGSIDPMCQPATTTCVDDTIDPHDPCCEQTVPELTDACTGDESTENPTSCTATGTVVVHTLELMEAAASCDIGFDLDGCNGYSCDQQALASDEGENGVDNGLTGLAPTINQLGNFKGLNQAFSDAICGLANDPDKGVCDGGDNDGDACTVATGVADCPGGECDDTENVCADKVEGPALLLTLGVDANVEENCANVEIKSTGACGTGPGVGSATACTSDDDCDTAGETCLGGGTSMAIINLSDATTEGTVCASGTLGTIPVSLKGVPAAFGNVVVQATVSQTLGFSGLLGSTVDETTAVAIAELLVAGGGAVVGSVLDINANLTQDTSLACNALSTGLVVGGTAPPAQQ